MLNFIKNFNFKRDEVPRRGSSIKEQINLDNVDIKIKLDINEQTKINLYNNIDEVFPIFWTYLFITAIKKIENQDNNIYENLKNVHKSSISIEKKMEEITRLNELIESRNNTGSSFKFLNLLNYEKYFTSEFIDSNDEIKRFVNNTATMDFPTDVDKYTQIQNLFKDSLKEIIRTSFLEDKSSKKNYDYLNKDYRIISKTINHMYCSTGAYIYCDIKSINTENHYPENHFPLFYNNNNDKIESKYIKKYGISYAMLTCFLNDDECRSLCYTVNT